MSDLYYDRRSVGQSVLVSSTHLGLMTRFLLLSDICWCVDMGRPLWREDGSVVYNCCCLCHRSHSQVCVPRGSWPHLLSQIWDSQNLEDQVPVFISPRNVDPTELLYLSCLITSGHGSHRKHRFPLLYPINGVETCLCAKPLLSNSCLRCLRSSCLEQICHNIHCVIWAADSIVKWTTKSEGNWINPPCCREDY
jgi:hypothetical protein